MGYRVDQELALPPEVYGHEIQPQVLEVFGIDSDAPQANLLLAQIAIVGARYGDKWHVAAVLASSPDKTLGSIRSDDDTSGNTVIATADGWIRDSEAAAWVPDRAVEIPLPEEFAPYERHGLILIRGHEIPEDLSARARVPEQTAEQKHSFRGPRILRRLRNR